MLDNLEEIKRKLRDMNAKAVSRESGVPYATICNLKNGRSKRIMYDNMKRLIDYFARII